MMKKLFLILFTAFTAISLSSCDEWLEANSSKRIPGEKLLETREGFEDALSGIYINLGSEEAYGQNMTWGIMDAAAYPYLVQQHPVMSYFQNHRYTNIMAKNHVGSIWSRAYNVIANINYVLEALEEKGEAAIASQTERNLFKAELLALRAYMHFDLLRIFGLPSWDGDNATKKTVPYVTVYDNKVTPQLTYEETANLLWDDINTALELFKDSDPVAMKPEDAENFEDNINIDGFWSNRQFHLNYYGTLALAARVCQWQNDTGKAAEYANQVIAGTLGTLVNWIDVEDLVSRNSDDQKDWTFSTEHIFSLEITNLSQKVTNSNWMFDTQNKNFGFQIDDDFVDGILYVRQNLETGSQAGLEDIRGPAMQLRVSSAGYYCCKFYGSSGYNVDYRNRIPMIRLSEMHYIIAEDHIAKGNKAEALKFLDIVRRNRGIGDDFPTDSDAALELEKEYYREFIGEGQLFYYLKHKNVTSSLNPAFEVSANKLIFLFPDAELDYGRNQEL